MPLYKQSNEVGMSHPKVYDWVLVWDPKQEGSHVGPGKKLVPRPQDCWFRISGLGLREGVGPVGFRGSGWPLNEVPVSPKENRHTHTHDGEALNSP